MIDNNTITFIGHSQLDNWPTNEIGGLSIVNLGIRGISSFQYNELICDKNLINYNSDIYLVMHGTNDIVYNYSLDEICQSIKKILII